MQTIKSAGAEILHAGKKVFGETIDIYRAAVTYLIGVVNTEWALVSEFEGHEQSKYVEHLIHNTAGRKNKKTGIVSGGNVAKYDFDGSFSTLGIITVSGRPG